MKKLIDYGKEHGTEILNLEVRCDNTAAIHLYEKFGFQHIETIPAFFKVGSESIDFAMLYLDLREMVKE